MPLYSQKIPQPPRAILWTGAVNNAWDTTTSNWELLSRDSYGAYFRTGTATTYADGDIVRINACNLSPSFTLPTPTANITIAADVAPFRVVVNTGTTDYGGSYGHPTAAVSFSGPGRISGPASIWVAGNGSLAINNDNQHTGGTYIGRLDDFALYGACGVNNFSSWTTTSVSVGSNDALGSGYAMVEIGGVSPVCSTGTNDTYLYLNGHSNHWNTTIVQSGHIVA